jgi:3'-5' exoribonuclease
MSKARVRPVILSQVEPGVITDFFALLAEKTRQSTRDGKPFYQCRFQDAHRVVTTVVWSDAETYPSCESQWLVGGYYKIRGTYYVHEKYGPQIEILQLREVRAEDHADGFQETDMLERSRYSSEELFEDVKRLAEGIRDEALQRLVMTILDEHRVALFMLPASDRRFYPFPGGWLEHVRNVTQVCGLLMAQYQARYPEMTLQTDAILAGAILHDIGRVRELSPGVAGAVAELTTVGRVLGHLQLGRDIVREAARAFPELRAELLLLVEHIILSHLALPEWGSPRLPVAPEVLILHHADDLDAKLEMFARSYRKDTGAGQFTERDPVLGKPLWKRPGLRESS